MPFMQYANLTESFEHLFFLCDYSKTILLVALEVGNWQHMPIDWSGLVDRLVQFRGRKLTQNIMSLTLAVSFYKIWEARNKKIHQNELAPPARLAKNVVHIIKCGLAQDPSFMKATNTDQFYCNWLL